MIKKLTVKYLAISLFLLGPMVSIAQKGEVKGVVRDKKTNETIIGANILIKGTSLGVTSDINGAFSLKNIPAGKYDISISFISYKTILYEDVKVSADKPVVLNPLMEEEVTAIQGVTITERRKTDSEISAISAIKSSNLVVSAISSQQIVKSQDKDASEVIRRVPGITIIDGRFVVVRGLIERYNTVWLNATAAPSSESDVKAFSFDVIPSSMLDRILVFKTPAPELQADFAGAAIQVFTKNLPEKNAVNVSYGAGFQTGTTLKDLYRYPGGKTDWLGFDDGTRSLPDGMPGTEEMLYTLQDFSDGTPAEVIAARKMRLEEIARSFSNTSASSKMTAPLNHRFSFDLVRRFQLSKWEVGNITSLNYSNSYNTDEIHRAAYEVFDTIKNVSVYVYDYRDKQYNQSANIGFIHNWSFVRGRNTLEFRNLLNQAGKTRTTLREGIDYYRTGNLVKSYELGYRSRTTYSGQISGTHKTENEKTSIDWTLGYSFATKLEPDIRRIYTYSTMLIDENGDTTFTPYKLDYAATVNTESNGRLFISTREKIYVAGANLSRKFYFGDFVPELKAGIYLERKDRNFDIRSFGIARAVPMSQFDQRIFTQSIDSIYDDSNFNFTQGLKLIEDTRPEYSYHAENELFAAYIGVKVPVLRNFNLYAGIRAEQNNQHLSDFQAITDTITPNIKKDTLNFFPSANLSYNLTDKSLLRLAYGLTVNRPEFREIAPYSFYDFELSATIYGNDSLKNAYVHNLDLRFEWYPTVSEMLTIGAFYKKFTNPIEMNFFPASNGWDFVFVNSKEAKALGVEIDIRKSFSQWKLRPDFLRYFKDFTLVFNTSVINSEVVSEAAYVRSKKRPMQGQSPYIVNAGLYYQNDRNKWMFSLLYNIIGKRIMIVGTPEKPDIFEMPRNLLDFTFSKRIGEHWQIKGGVKDILNEKVLYKQIVEYEKAGEGSVSRDQEIRSWIPGTGYSLGVSYSF